MFRKRRQPAPHFKMPGAPFNPATGENALLGQYPNKGTTLALFQVIEEDTHDNYVVCRGHEADDDPYFRYLHDPYTVLTTTPINVAKPYSVRGTFPYELGQVLVAARIKGKLGFNPGKAVTVGQPADLDEVISLLTDDAGVGIAWMEVGGTPSEADGAIFGTWNQYGLIGTSEQSSTMTRSGGTVSGCTYGGSNPSSFLKQLTATSVFDLLLNLTVNFAALSAMGANSGLFTIRVKVWDNTDTLVNTVYTRAYAIASTTTSQSFSAWLPRLTMQPGYYITVTYQSGGAYTGGWTIWDESLFARSIVG